ncbi:MAG TPA: hypothetical protein VJQ53_05295 [Candidatus Eisenbacteria bacterium]|nr:hypothetical protein [Candidatus Eisenbacteria bacterium]
MKRAPLLCSLLLFATSAFAEPGVTDIRLGTPAPAPAPVDGAKVKAVERFLAARQTGSVDRDLASRARALLRTKERVDATTLFGPEKSTLAAFDFHDEAIEPAGSGRFHVSVFLLFANDAGQVVESRDEELTFARAGDSYFCEGLRVTNRVEWSQADVLEAARSLGASRELDEAQRYLRQSATGKSARVAYSVADVQKNADGSIVVQCLRFKSDPGRRGFAVTTAPIVLSRSDDSIRVEPN